VALTFGKSPDPTRTRARATDLARSGQGQCSLEAMTSRAAGTMAAMGSATTSPIRKKMKRREPENRAGARERSPATRPRGALGPGTCGRGMYDGRTEEH